MRHARALVVTAVPLGALAALAGVYPWATLPILIAAAAAFVICAPPDIASAPHRVLDAALLVCLAGIALQLAPLPPGAAAALSPRAAPVQELLTLPTGSDTRTLSIDALLTRQGFASALSAVLVFWAARGVFGIGGLRSAARVLGVAGFVTALVGLAQRATAPTLLLWTWTPVHAGATPFGPFVNRNHFATWLLMMAALTAGYTAAHVRTHQLLQNLSRRLVIRNLLREGNGLFFGGAVGLMTLTLISSLSRGALVGAAVAVVVGYLLSRNRLQGQHHHRRHRRGGAGAGIGLVAALLLAGVWLHLGGLATRVVPGTEASRSTIWRETLPIVADFPLTGTGIGTFARSMTVYQKTTPEILFNHAHSEYVQLAAEGGLLITVPAVVAIAAWLVLAWRRIRADRREMLWLRIGAAAGIAGVAVQSLWDSPLRIPANALMLALLAAVVTHKGE